MPTKRPKRPTTKLLALDAIRLDGETQCRVDLSEGTIEDYADAYDANAELPPLVVFYDGSDYWLADGFHRWYGARKADLAKVPCEIHEGTVEDARWYSCAANQTHGLRRTNADKAKAVQAALRHPAGVELSNEQIAKHCGVDAKTVAKYREAMKATLEIPESTKRTGADGRTIDTQNIGRRPANLERDPESFELGRCKTPGKGECDCDACQELARLPEDQRRGAYQEACERFQTQYPKPIEIRQVVNEWAEAVELDASPENDEERCDEEDGSEVEEAAEEAPVRPQMYPKRSIRDDLREAVQGVWENHPEISQVTLRAILMELVENCGNWERR
jgi:hypothetical protein